MSAFCIHGSWQLQAVSAGTCVKGVKGVKGAWLADKKIIPYFVVCLSYWHDNLCSVKSLQ